MYKSLSFPLFAFCIKSVSKILIKHTYKFEFFPLNTAANNVRGRISMTRRPLSILRTCVVFVKGVIWFIIVSVPLTSLFEWIQLYHYHTIIKYRRNTRDHLRQHPLTAYRWNCLQAIYWFRLDTSCKGGKIVFINLHTMRRQKNVYTEQLWLNLRWKWKHIRRP